MEENRCYDIVKPPPHKSWIISLHSDHGAKALLPSLSSDRIVMDDLISHEEESDQQHSEDVARSINLFDPESQPDHSADGMSIRYVMIRIRAVGSLNCVVRSGSTLGMNALCKGWQVVHVLCHCPSPFPPTWQCLPLAGGQSLRLQSSIK
eukprot:1691467-Amphidinium_carterae.1